MAKYLMQASFTSEGLKGLQKDKASGRRDAIAKALESVGGRLEALYFTLGEYDDVLIIEAPNLESIAAFCVQVNASGVLRTRTTALLSVEEADRALAKTVAYRAPGQ
ncbi:GYD domain-containing protein [Reyranella sp.]|uniref:GYD domain-containing protein n=1 Tax=Reyranella sp. TaxID=1929291 RepID=UPI003D12BAFE